ncbi:MAG: methyltransferase [Myxococcales bacterium]|nr:methyltransferase [Myxococcales bacterium]
MAEDVLGDDPLAEQRWPLALVWPRAHLGKDFSEQCLAVAATHLSPGGRLLCAVRKARGGASLKRVMEALLGNVRVIARDRGYHLHASEHAGQLNLELARELIERRYAWRDPLLGDVELLGVPGVFSRKHLDVGTAALLRHLEHQDGALPQTPARVLDLGCGLGALSLWAARRWPSTRVLALETNVLAASLTRVNAARAGVEARVAVLNQDALEEPALERSFVGDCELALVNPPTHANAEVFSALVATPRRYLRPGSPAWFVVNRVGALRKALARSEASIDAHVEAPGFHLVRARWG